MGTLALNGRYEGGYDALRDRVGIEFHEGVLLRNLSHQSSVCRRSQRSHQKSPPRVPLMVSRDAGGSKS
jgi:hypothetical protein